MKRDSYIEKSGIQRHLLSVFQPPFQNKVTRLENG